VRSSIIILNIEHYLPVEKMGRKEREGKEGRRRGGRKEKGRKERQGEEGRRRGGRKEKRMWGCTVELDNRNIQDNMHACTSVA